MNSEPREQRPYGLVIGLFAGTVIGAALAMWLAPNAAAELRERVGESTRTLGKRASREYQATASRIGDAVDELTKKGQAVRDELNRPFISS